MRKIVKIVFICFLCYCAFIPFVKAQTPDLSPEKLANRKNLNSKKVEKDTLYIRNADQIIYSQKKDKAGYSKALLYGNVYIVYNEKQIYSDQMEIRFLNDKAKIVHASGNVIIQTEKTITVGDRLVFYTDKNTGIIYNAETYNKPFFIQGDYFKFIGEKKVIGENLDFTNCDILPPHYSIGASKGWIYEGDMDMYSGFSIKAGRDPIFYFPFMYRSYYGTGLKTALGRENGIGWMVHNTYQTKGKNSEFKLMIDHYQKLGEYFGVEYKKTDIGTLNVKAALIYDKHIKYESSSFTNYFEEVDGEGETSGRSLRYKLDLSYERTIADGKNFLGLTTKISGKFYEPTDPSIASQYESRRLETFDMKKILFPDDTPSSAAGSFSSGSGTGRKYSFSIENSILGYKLAFTGDWQYLMSKTDDTEDAKNRYRPEYYKNYKSSVVFPYFVLTKKMEMFDPFKIKGGNSKLKWPFSLEHNHIYKQTKSYSTGTLTTNAKQANINLALKFPFSYDLKPWALKVPFVIDHQDQFNWTKSYDSTSGEFSSNVSQNDYVLKGSYPPTFERTTEKTAFSAALTLSTTYQFHKQKTKNPTSTQEENDSTNTYNYLEQVMGTDVKYEFLKDYEYLESGVQGKWSYTYSKKFGDELPSTAKTETSRYDYYLKFFSLKTSFIFETYDNISDSISKANQKGPLNVTFESKIVPNLTMSNKYVYNRFYERGESNTYGMTAELKTKYEFTKNFWLNAFSLSCNWYKNYQEYKSDYLTYNYSIDFNYTKLWQFKLVFSGKNSQLYLYTDKASSDERKNILQDLKDSFKLWDTEARQRSSFKMKSFGLYIYHNLHKWKFEFSSTFTPKLDTSGSFYFESAFNFQLTLTEIPSLNPQKIEKTYGND